MKTLFGTKTISSISFSQDEIPIIHLHIPAGIELDATYGYGDFYKTINEPRIRFDLDPKVDGCPVADCSKEIPLPNGFVSSAIFDPPFILTEHKDSDPTIPARKYGYFKKISELRDMYESSIKEYHRVLQPGGVLVIKCQDMAHALQNHFVHVEVMNTCSRIGFKPIDLFILLARNRFTGNVGTQRVARKFHSYFIVFKKKHRG
jgi:hypothetical protein